MASSARDERQCLLLSTSHLSNLHPATPSLITQASLSVGLSIVELLLISIYLVLLLLCLCFISLADRVSVRLAASTRSEASAAQPLPSRPQTSSTFSCPRLAQCSIMAAPNTAKASAALIASLARFSTCEVSSTHRKLLRTAPAHPPHPDRYQMRSSSSSIPQVASCRVSTCGRLSE